MTAEFALHVVPQAAVGWLGPGVAAVWAHTANAGQANTASSLFSAWFSFSDVKSQGELQSAFVHHWNCCVPTHLMSNHHPPDERPRRQVHHHYTVSQQPTASVSAVPKV